MWALASLRKKQIPQNSYIALAKLIPTIYVNPYTFDILTQLNKIPWTYSNFYGKQFETYTSEYGHYFSRYGEIEVFVDSTSQCLINHGSVGANDVGSDMNITEVSADPSSIHM
mmetsp:Transcript_53284/g.59579  ORF Transcript_53284/g.59579 Transcript_53284/m.59579 type:complete len:113 (+) Transcript_53284:306-644(+)